MEATVSQVAEQFFAPFVAVPMPQNLKGSVQVLRLVLRVQISARICDRLWKSQSHQLPSSFCAPSVVLQVPQNLEESVEVLRVEAGSLATIM